VNDHTAYCIQCVTDRQTDSTQIQTCSRVLCGRCEHTQCSSRVSRPNHTYDTRICPAHVTYLYSSHFHYATQLKSYQTIVNITVLPSVLWHCWLGDRKGILPVKTEWWGAGVVVCLERGADLRIAQLMPLPLTVSCFSKIQIGFTFLVPAYLGSPGKRDVKRAYVCMYVVNITAVHKSSYRQY